MEECQTPTLAQMMEFKYELTPTMVFESGRLQEEQNLLVNRIHVRCFTPIIKNVQSPGLSPINECVAFGVATNVENLQKSVPLTATIKEEYFKAPVGKAKNVQQKLPAHVLQQQQQHQQQQQQQQLYKQPTQQHQQQQLQKVFYRTHFISDSPPVFTLNSTVNSDADFSVEIPSPDSSAILGNLNGINNSNNNNNGSGSNNSSGSASLNNSNNTSTTFTNSNNNNNNNYTSNLSSIINLSNILDRTINLSTLLRDVGLEEYIEPFEQKNLDLEQFLNIRTEDFQRLGVRKAEHQTILMDLWRLLNRL